MSKVIQVRDLPEEVHEALVRRAKRRGMSLSAYLREVLTEEASVPTPSELELPPGGLAPHVTNDQIVSALHEARAEQEAKWS